MLRCQARRMGISCSKDPNCPVAVRGGILKARGGGGAGGVISTRRTLGWAGIKVRFRASSASGVAASLGSVFLPSPVFIWWGSASRKNNFGMFVGPLGVYFREFSDSAVLLVYTLKCYQFPSPAAILCFYIFSFLDVNSWTGPSETQGGLRLKRKPLTSKDRGLRLGSALPMPPWSLRHALFGSFCVLSASLGNTDRNREKMTMTKHHRSWPRPDTFWLAGWFVSSSFVLTCIYIHFILNAHMRYSEDRFLMKYFEVNSHCVSLPCSVLQWALVSWQDFFPAWMSNQVPIDEGQANMIFLYLYRERRNCSSLLQCGPSLEIWPPIPTLWCGDTKATVAWFCTFWD